MVGNTDYVADGTYFLSSLDSSRFEPVRRFTVTRTLAFDTGKPAVEGHLDPPVVGQDFDLGDDITSVIVTSRLGDNLLELPLSLPAFVYITIPRRAPVVLESPVRRDDLVIIGWGELYRTRTDAEQHILDWS